MEDFTITVCDKPNKTDLAILPAGAGDLSADKRMQTATR